MAAQTETQGAKAKKAVDMLIDGLFKHLTEDPKKKKEYTEADQGPFFQLAVDEIEKLATDKIPALETRLITLPMILAIAPLDQLKKFRPETHKRLVDSVDSLIDTLEKSREGLIEAMKED